MLNFGIISTARINHDAMLLPVSKRDDVFIKAVASRSLHKAKSYAEVKNIPFFYGSYAELLEDPAIDAVYISTPNSFHVPWVREALLKNKHVLCEKPFSPTYSEALDLIKLAKSKGLLLMEAMHYAYHPTVRQIINELQDGKLGEIENVFTQLGIPTPFEGDIRYQINLMGGSFMHLGCYCLHFIQNILNIPLRLDNVCVEKKDKQSADVLSIGNLKSTKGLDEFLFKTTFKDRHLNSFAKIQGTKGSLTISSIFNPVSSKNKRFVDVIEIRSDVFNRDQFPSNVFHQTCYDFQLETFMNAIKKGDFTPLVDSRHAALIEQGLALTRPVTSGGKRKEKLLLAS
ncbi:MAG: Gfo/Idh/MocA family oxidoreductase [Alphaproteobacteria bacterium]|nr:Gfo/Idh/MocA family oxidoreductase [Alphaproteobacteria bacterium]